MNAPEWALSASPPELESVYALVDVDALNVRDAPSVDGSKIGLLHRGDRVEILAWAVGYDRYESEYVWAEVRAGDLRGYVAAEEGNYFWGEFGERYLVVEHAFGEPELTLTADLDSDGKPERIRVGPGEVHDEYEQFFYEKEYVYRLPLVLEVEGSFDAEVRLADFFLGTSTEEVPAEELINHLEEIEELGWYHNWSLYGLEAGDFNGDGAAELRLTLDFRSAYPSPVMGPIPTRRRVLGFAREDDGLRCIYGYTERAFVLGSDEDGPDGDWAYVEGGAELTPEALTYSAVMGCPEERVPFVNFRTIQVHDWIHPLDWVRHPLPPPNYLADGLWFSTELEARWVPEAGFYALYCPPDNDYARELGYAYSEVAPVGLLGVDTAESAWGLLKEPLTLFCLPGSETVVGTLEPGIWVAVQPYATRDGGWYLVSAIPYEAFTGQAPALAGWTRTPPKMEE
ncbi:MAG: hypothetical protein A2Y64_04130 [Candidatus Coatesbacteria bacterium RBG_13_66_14]|uniref:SH3b domain-containing protein n=1 Tax=Candidatus Coatesbacteria bacterium RBG_13_66_14 TaxID=1817816 RepID=A0A1F5FH52_9BACT|nr:MAG: hypothetical protein A2Y64_04130 [Candidatus Coatesbacteria bacterium RBG_13_66_14]